MNDRVPFDLSFVPSANGGDLVAPGEGIQLLDPITNPQWDSLVTTNTHASFFHGGAWAKVLHGSYGHRPFYLGRIVNGRLESLLAIMEVSSPLTGRRGVSLPFTDYCGVLSDDRTSADGLFQAAVRIGAERGWHYLECRSVSAEWRGSQPSLAFWSHVVDLRGSEGTLFGRLESSVRRGIRKAETARLQVAFLDDEAAMRTFFALHSQTRQRHGLPPQPYRFFDNITRHVLQADRGFIAVARLGETPIAAAVFFHQGKEAVYKFGASDYTFQQMRPNNLLMWEAIRKCSGLGLERLHMGRTSLGHEGLRRFKLGFGAHEEQIEYAKFDFKTRSFVSETDHVEGWFNHVFRAMPAPLLRFSGKVLYPHLS